MLVPGGVPMSKYMLENARAGGVRSGYLYYHLIVITLT
jgi:hypothetical protein